MRYLSLRGLVKTMCHIHPSQPSRTGAVERGRLVMVSVGGIGRPIAAMPECPGCVNAWGSWAWLELRVNVIKMPNMME